MRGSRFEPGLRPAAIPRSRRVGPRHNVQTEEDESTAPAKRPHVHLTITGANCSDGSLRFSRRPCRGKVIRGQGPEEWLSLRENTRWRREGSAATTAGRRLDASGPVLASSRCRGARVSGSRRQRPRHPRLRAYRGNTKKPENVEYFQPPMRLPRSSLR